MLRMLLLLYVALRTSGLREQLTQAAAHDHAAHQSCMAPNGSGSHTTFGIMAPQLGMMPQRCSARAGWCGNRPGRRPPAPNHLALVLKRDTDRLRCLSPHFIMPVQMVVAGGAVTLN